MKIMCKIIGHKFIDTGIHRSLFPFKYNDNILEFEEKCKRCRKKRIIQYKYYSEFPIKTTKVIQEFTLDDNRNNPNWDAYYAVKDRIKKRELEK